MKTNLSNEEAAQILEDFNEWRQDMTQRDRHSYIPSADEVTGALELAIKALKDASVIRC